MLTNYNTFPRVILESSKGRKYPDHLLGLSGLFIRPARDIFLPLAFSKPVRDYQDTPSGSFILLYPETPDPLDSRAKVNFLCDRDKLGNFLVVVEGNRSVAVFRTE